MRVICYRNLRRQVWSIAEVRGTNGIGRVLAHEKHIILADVTFLVKEAARQRVIRNRRREVHAWAVGDVVRAVPSGRRVPITYNPYRAATFTIRDNHVAVYAAPIVEFTASKGAIIVMVARPAC